MRREPKEEASSSSSLPDQFPRGCASASCSQRGAPLPLQAHPLACGGGGLAAQEARRIRRPRERDRALVGKEEREEEEERGGGRRTLNTHTALHHRALPSNKHNPNRSRFNSLRKAHLLSPFYRKRKLTMWQLSDCVIKEYTVGFGDRRKVRER